jgi:DnaJ-class molecular chaperone
MNLLERTCPDCRGEGKQTGDGGGMDGGGNYHQPPCATCDDEGQVVPAHAYRGAVDHERALAEAILSLADSAGMPDSFRETDSRMILARETLDRLGGQ